MVNLTHIEKTEDKNMNKLKSIPLPAIIFLATLSIGLVTSKTNNLFIAGFNQAFIGSLGYFALILIPSFLMASTLSKLAMPRLGVLTKLLAPLAGAGMICPDTAYAAMSPIAKDQKPSILMGTYASFKLLPPAGPLIISAALGINEPRLLTYGFILLVPVWLVGELFISFFSEKKFQVLSEGKEPQNFHSLVPLAITAVMIFIGISVTLDNAPTIIIYLFHPAGALLSGAVYAWWLVPDA
jgi:gluconate:H+ symporter, GntP family